MPSTTSELLNQHTLVRAGAGAGKTTRLIDEVIFKAKSHYEQFGHFPRMVLTTFTRKATQEIKERLILKACELNDQKLLEYLSSNVYLQISTLHGVMSLFLRRYGHLVQLDNGYTIMTEEEATREARILVRDMAIKDTELSDILALFGVARLTSLFQKMSSARLEHPHFRSLQREDFEIYWKEFWINKGANIQRVLKQVQQSTNDEKYVDYVQIIAQVLKDLIGLYNSPSKDVDLLLERIPTKPRFNKKNPKIPEDLDKSLSEAVAELKKLCRGPEARIVRWDELTSVFSKIEKYSQIFHEQYLAKKKTQGRFEMTDLENITVDILRTHEGLASAFASDFDYWLIDEYQDTSPIQVELLKLLIGEKPTFVVGDPQQSIYLFRGARAEVFQQKEKEMKELGTQPEYKKKNWRSRPELLEFFNHLFTSIDEDFLAMEPREAVQSPESVVAYFCETQKPDKDNDEKSHFHAIGEHISQLLEAGSLPEDICILARTHVQLTEVAHYLRFHDFPTHVHVASGFYERREILDAMALLKFLVNSQDNFNLILLLRSPWCRVSDNELAHFLSKCRRENFWGQIESSQNFQQHHVIQKLIALRQLRNNIGISACFEKALMEFGFIDFSHHHDISGRRESNIWKLLTQLKEEEKKPGFSYLQFLNRSFTEMDTEAGSQESDAVASLEPHHIQLMTIHASKGLQFRHVIVPDIGKGAPPTRTAALGVDESRQIWTMPLPLGENGENEGSIVDLTLRLKRKQQEEKESLRVFYVAATRAKDSIFLSWEEAPKKDSWREKLPFLFSEGTHQEKYFSYVFRRGPFQECFYKSKEIISSSVRALYSKEFSPQFEKKSVTALISTGSNKKVRTLTQLIPERIKKTADGTAVHRMMEILHSNWNFLFEEVAKDWFGDNAKEMVEAVHWVKDLKEPPMKTLIQNGYVEWGYQMVKENLLLEGQVDLWGEVDGTVWIIDYKTGSQKYEAQAFQQLQIYAEAIKAYTEAKDIRLCVIYPLDKTVKVRE
ncbi:MAG: UvrD-helicase domain-containing protein [Bdellovibrionales bacterium]|nr:UvrD-helicase domain-containing protein [Bdellovibrionales bacterium]